MAIIQSGASATQWTIDTTSDAGRVTVYDQYGNAMSDVNSLSNVLNALNAVVTIVLGGQATLGINVGSTSGTLTLSFEATIDNSTWFSINATPVAGGATITSTSANGQWVASTSGFYAIRTRVSVFTSGSMTVSILVTPHISAGIAQTVSGTVSQGTANTLSNAWPMEVTDGTNVLGTSSHPIKIDPTGTTTQPVSGTVTSNIGTTNGLALDTSVNGILVAQGSTTSGESGPLIQGAVTTAAPTYTTAKTSPLSLTTVGALRIDGSAVTQPVSGTVTANIGTSGSLALDASVTGLQVSQGSTTSGQKGDLTLGAVTTSAPSYTTAQTSPLSLTTSGALRIDGSAVTQPVSGTVTSNIGTTNGLSLDTSVNGILVSQGSTTSGEKGPLIQGAVTTSAPSYVTTQTSPLSLTTAGALRTDSSATTQPVSGTVTANAGAGTFTVSGTVTNNQGTANTVANAWPIKVTDGTNTTAVKAASTIAITTDPSLVVAISPNSIAAKDRSSIGFGSQMTSPISGSDNGIARSIRVGEFGTQRTTSEVMLWHDAIEGTTVNVFWTQSTTTMTIAQTTGVLTLNNSNITTANTDAIITSQRQFPKYPRNPLYVRFRANITANVAANHTLIEFGLGAPAGVTAIINNGVFYRWTAAGNLNAVFSFGGTEQSTQILSQGSISTTEYYYYDIAVDDDYARFIISDSGGVPIVDTQVDITNTVAYLWSVSHTPSFARVYADATGGGTAIKLNISAHSVQMLDSLFGLTWAEQSAMVLRSAQYSPTAYTATPSFTTDANTTPSVSSGLAAFGGEFIASTYPVSTSNLLEHFAYQVPTPYSLVLTGVNISPDVVSTAFTGGPVSLAFYLWVNASTGNTSTATGGTKIPLGTRFFTSSQVVGNVGTQLMWSPKTPLVCLPGTFIIMGVKSVGTAVTAGVIRHVWTPEGYFI